MRDIIAAALCDAEIGIGAWDQMPPDRRVFWFQRADRVAKQLADRGFTVKVA